MTARRDPRAALDYPALDDALFIIWHGNEFRWPDARRSTSYLSSTKTDVMRGYALFTTNDADAMTFATEGEARAWLADQEAKRLRPYGVTVSTVAELKAARGYVVEG